MESKTVKQWLEMLPHAEVRLRALALMEKREADTPALSIRHALRVAFIWTYTPEGATYWQRVFDALEIMDSYEVSKPSAKPSDHDRMPKYSWNHVFAEGYNTYATDSDRFNDTEDYSY